MVKFHYQNGKVHLIVDYLMDFYLQNRSKVLFIKYIFIFTYKHFFVFLNVLLTFHGSDKDFGISVDYESFLFLYFEMFYDWLQITEVVIFGSL